MSANKISGSQMFFQILFKSLKVRKKRVSIVFFSIVIGAAVITALLSVYFDISIKMAQELRTYGANFFMGPRSSLYDRTIDYHIFKEAINKIPDGKLIAASPYVYGIVRLDLGNAVMAGVDFSGLKELSPYWQVEGKWITIDFDEKHCMVGKSLAKNMGLKVGDRVNVINRETGFQKTLIVRGIVETGQAEDEQIFVNLSLAQKILGLEGRVNHAFLSIVSEGMDIDGFAEALEIQFKKIDAKPIRKVSYAEGKILDKVKGLMTLTAAIIMIIATLCVMTTLMAMVVERRREIGLMKALGADSRSIVLQFLSEMGVISLAGTVMGVIVGFVLAQILGQGVFNSSISFRVLVFPITLLVSLIATLIASVIPVKMAVKVMPAQVLKEE